MSYARSARRRVLSTVVDGTSDSIDVFLLFTHRIASSLLSGRMILIIVDASLSLGEMRINPPDQT